MQIVSPEALKGYWEDYKSKLLKKLQDDGEVSDYDDTEENEENIVSVFKKTFHEILRKKK